MNTPTPVESHRIPAVPADFPGLIAFWDMQTPGPTRAATAGEPYVLEEMAGPVEHIADDGAPFGPFAARLREGQWMRIPRGRCPLLDIHGPAGHLTLIAWIKRAHVTQPHCEFIAGQWNETNRGRQYGLFLDINVWGGRNQVCGHVSNLGGPTPGYRYCMDGAIGATEIAFDQWHAVAMTYDSIHARAWLDGRLDGREAVNPYLLPGGLHDGGPQGSDFTVGAVHRAGEMGNFFTGLLGGLAIYNRNLTPAELWAVSRPLEPAP